MAEKEQKKHSFGIFFFVCFLAVLGISIIGNFKSRQYVEIDVPGGSIERLFTIEDKLVAIATGPELLVWDWADLTKPTLQKSFDAKMIILLAGERIIQVPKGKENTFVVTDLRSGVTQKTHSFGLEWKIDIMQINRKGNFVVFVLKSSDPLKDGSSQRIKLALYDASKGRIVSVSTIISDETIEIYDAAISDSADLVAVSGRKKSGWLGVYESKDRKLLWEKNFSDSPELEQVEFSPDDKYIFAGWIDKKVVQFEIKTSSVVKSWDMEKSDKSQQDRMRLAALKISSDGRFLLAGKEVKGSLWVWDLQNDTDAEVFPAGNIHISDIAVSDNSTLAVTTGFKKTDKTRVWKLVK